MVPAIDTLNAFCPHGLIERRRSATGPLAGLRFALKDAFDLAGVATGAGSPEWLATHAVPDRSAPIVDTLLDAGATLAGKTTMDELAWSLIGENAHYGTPVNVAAPGHVPGGSSSGSAAVVAAGIVDFSIGSDTGGSRAVAGELLRDLWHAPHTRAGAHQRRCPARAELRYGRVVRA